jgi:outer membrane protein assembly factor BamB
MSANRLTRRAALLSAALLPGCGSLDSLFGERKVRLPGERTPILTADTDVTADADAPAVTLPAPSAVAEWPVTGGTTTHAPGHVALGERLALAWRASAGSGSAYRQRLTSGPVIAGGVVYAMDAWGYVSAVTLADGRSRWRADTTPEDESDVPIGGGVAVADGVVFATTGLAELLALEAADGRVRWRVRLPAPARGAPTVADGRVFVAVTSSQLLALSVEDGRTLWTHRGGGTMTTMPLGLPAPAVEGEIVVAAFPTGEIVAVRISDGRLQWGESLGSTALLSLADFVGVTALPVIAEGRLIAVGLANTTIAVDMRSGRRLWERPFGGAAGVGAAGDWAFAVTSAGEALAIGREDGQIRWITPLDPPPPPGTRRGPPLLLGMPLVGGGRVIVPSSRGELLLLDPGTGALQGRIPTGSGVTLPMAAAEGTLVVLTDDGTLMAFR